MPAAGFDALIAPLKRASFLERYFGRKTASLLGGGAERFSTLERLLGSEALARAPVVHAASVDVDGQQREIVAAPDQLDSLRASGMTLCADVSKEAEVARLLAQIHARLRLGDGPGFAKLYWSPAGKGFAPHFDPHHVFVLQLSGEKRWWFAETPAVPWAHDCGCIGPQGHAIYTTGEPNRAVLDSKGSSVEVPSRGDLRTEVLQPGDVLYLPPGTWHTTEAAGDSRALSLSPARLSTGRLLLDLLGQRLANDSHAIADLTGSVGLDPHLDAGLKALRAAVADLHPSQLRHAWASRVFATKLAGTATHPAPASLTRDTRLLHTATDAPSMHLEPVCAADESVVGIALFREGLELAFPPQARQFLGELLRCPEFSAREAMRWDRSMSWDATAAALSTLVKFGFVRVADAATTS